MANKAQPSARIMVLLAIKLAVSISLMAWLASLIDWLELALVLKQADLLWLTCAFLTQGLVLLLANVRWWLLLRPLAKIRFAPTQTPYWYGAFANNFLPAGLGADLARVGARFDPRLKRRAVLASVTVERLLALFSLTLICGAALAIRGEALGWPVMWGLVLTVGSLVGLGTLVLPFSVVRIWNFLPGRSAIIEGLSTGIDRIRADRANLLGAFAVALALQMLCLVNFHFLGIALGATQPWWHYWLAVPVALLAAALPISFGGLGVREAAYVTLAANLGMDRDVAAAVSFLFVVELVVLTVPGVLVGLGMRTVRRR